MSVDLNSINDQYLIYICLNDKYRSLLKKHFKILRQQYRDRDDWADIERMINADSLSVSDFEVYLSRSQIVGPARNQAIELFNYADQVTDVGDAFIKDSLKKLISSQLIAKVASEPDPSKFIDNLKEYDLDLTTTATEELIKENYNFGEVDIKAARESLGDPIYSSQKAINEAFIIGGYIKHQLIGVVAAPGNGKSLFCMNEVAQFLIDGRKVLYVALGDLMQIDFVTRLAAIMLNITIDDATNNIEAIYIRLKNKFGHCLNNLKILYMDPGTVTIEKLKSYLKGENPDKVNYFEEYSICILDYDTNFLDDRDMYQKGEAVYNEAAAWSKIFDLVFMVSQPKSGYSNCEIIPQEGLAESWRKAQILDAIIAIGRNPDSVNPVGSIHLAKVRRGGIRTVYKYYLGLNGRFCDIGNAQYHMLASAKDRIILDSIKQLTDEESEGLNSVIQNELDKELGVKHEVKQTLSSMNNVDSEVDRFINEKKELSTSKREVENENNAVDSINSAL